MQKARPEPKASKSGKGLSNRAKLRSSDEAYEMLEHGLTQDFGRDEALGTARDEGGGLADEQGLEELFLALPREDARRGEGATFPSQHRNDVDEEALGVGTEPLLEGRSQRPAMVFVMAYAPSRNSFGTPVTGCGVLSHLAASGHLRKYSA